MHIIAQKTNQASILFTAALADHLQSIHPLIKNPHTRDRARKQCFQIAEAAMVGFPDYDIKTQAVEAGLDLQQRQKSIQTNFNRLEKQRDKCTSKISQWAWQHATDDEQEIRDQAEEWEKRLIMLKSAGATRLYRSQKAVILSNVSAKEEPKKGITQKWLRRKIRFVTRQARESGHLLFKDIGKGRQEYASDGVTEDRQTQLRVQELWLDCTTAVNTEDTEEKFTLSKIARNARTRLAEALAVTNALEKIAKKRNYSMLFITLTLPPEYHPNPANKPDSDKWDGSNPVAGQQYITKKWARVRALFKKRDIKNLYLRTAEPHADSAPHWHIMLWTDDADESERIIKQHFQHSDNAVEIKRLDYKEDEDDNKKASATSYLLKYVLKTLPADTSTNEFSDDNTPRVDAWRATYGIRALQYGGLPRGAITAWRESRRAAVGKNVVIPIESIPLLTAAKNGDFELFVNSMIALDVKLLKKRDTWTEEEAEKAAEAEDDGKTVIGIKTDEWSINTHTKRWSTTMDKDEFFEKLKRINEVTVRHNDPSDRPNGKNKPTNSKKTRKNAEAPPKTAPPEPHTATFL